MRYYLAVPLFLLLIIYSGCTSTPEIIRDISSLKQDNTFYLEKSSANSELVTSDYQKMIDRKYNRLFFLPWHMERVRYSKNQAVWGFKKHSKAPGYGENKRRHDREWIEKLSANAALETYPNTGIRAITIANTDLRVLPTHKPLFYDFNLPGEGYPFDYLQNSAIAANTPIYITHISEDKSWVLADSHYALGWIPIRDIAFVNKKFISAWENNCHIVVTRDKVPVYDRKGTFIFKAPLGALFPKSGETGRYYEIFVAVANESREAVIKKGIISKSNAGLKPLRITSLNVATLANELINEPYGWGGMYQNRDCSALMKDLFAPFGIWLPRNSTDQAATGGIFIDLGNLSPKEKEKMIIDRGVPYLTLIWARGHIMLYIGAYQGKALVFHNLWGIRTRSFLGKEGRKVIGHAAITTVSPGKELSNFDKNGEILNRIVGIILLIPPQEEQVLNVH